MNGKVIDYGVDYSLNSATAKCAAGYASSLKWVLEYLALLVEPKREMIDVWMMIPHPLDGLYL